MYQKPTLERFGSLRELTLLGLGSVGQCVWAPCQEDTPQRTS